MDTEAIQIFKRRLPQRLRLSPTLRMHDFLAWKVSPAVFSEELCPQTARTGLRGALSGVLWSVHVEGYAQQYLNSDHHTLCGGDMFAGNRGLQCGFCCKAQ